MYATIDSIANKKYASINTKSNKKKKLYYIKYYKHGTFYILSSQSPYTVTCSIISPPTFSMLKSAYSLFFTSHTTTWHCLKSYYWFWI